MSSLRCSESIAVARSPEAQIADRAEAARRGIPVTLAALKRAAEAG